jgi:hypothetical protein
MVTKVTQMHEFAMRRERIHWRDELMLYIDELDTRNVTSELTVALRRIVTWMDENIRDYGSLVLGMSYQYDPDSGIIRLHDIHHHINFVQSGPARREDTPVDPTLDQNHDVFVTVTVTTLTQDIPEESVATLDDVFQLKAYTHQWDPSSDINKLTIPMIVVPLILIGHLVKEGYKVVAVHCPEPTADDNHYAAELWGEGQAVYIDFDYAKALQMWETYNARFNEAMDKLQTGDDHDHA